LNVATPAATVKSKLSPSHARKGHPTHNRKRVPLVPARRGPAPLRRKYQLFATTSRRASVSLPFLAPATPTLVPTATLLGSILAWSLIATNLSAKVQVRVYPSADFTVPEVAVIAVTAPRWTTTPLVPSSVWTVASPCSIRLPKPNLSSRWRIRAAFPPAWPPA